MSKKFTYSIINDFGGIEPNYPILHNEINNDGGIGPLCININRNSQSDSVEINFVSNLNGSEQSILDGIVSSHDGNAVLPFIDIKTTGDSGTSVNVNIAQTANRVINLPDANTNLIGDDTINTLTNKTITDTSNNIAAKSLYTSSTIVNISSASAPTNGQVLTATNSTTAGWQDPISDITGPISSLDKGLVTFNGTTGKVLQSVGIRHYGANSTDPTSPTPQAGDKYYNTTINHEMCYDASRNKWLSITTMMEGCGYNGNVSANNFYKRFNGMTLSTTKGTYIPKGTLIYIGFNTTNAITHTFEVLINGVVIASLSSDGGTSASIDTINADFESGILSFRNQVGSSTTSYLQATIFYKLRA